MYSDQNRKWRLIVALAAMGSIGLLNKSIAQPGDPDDDERGVEVLTRGPVHEAFAETVTFNPEPGMIAPNAPREIIEEVPPDQRPEGANVTWIPGYWGWDEERNDFLWVSGVWRDLPPGRQWVPGYWDPSSRGSQWISGYWADAEVGETEYLPEPPESVEYGPNVAAPAMNQAWVPGTWLWQQNRYAWRPGYWAAGRADWVWVPAHYIWAPRGYVFSDGYWDHTMERRGVLFAPVYFEQEVYSRPNYTYSPSFAINVNVFSDQLFVRPRYQHYYFGDYYDRRYEETGFFASFSFQSSRRGYDPIYAHRRWEHRNDRDWDRHDRDDFNHRRDYKDARPPRTLREQRERGGREARPGEKRIEVASAFDGLTKRNDGRLRFQKVDQPERQQLAQRGRIIQSSRGERQKLETKTAPTANDKPSKSVQPVRLKNPKPVVVSRPIAQLDKGKAPPKRQKSPVVDPRVEPKTKRTVRPTEAGRNPDARKSDPSRQTPKNEPRVKRDEPKRDAPRTDPRKDKSNDESKDEKKRKPRE